MFGSQQMLTKMMSQYYPPNVKFTYDKQIKTTNNQKNSLNKISNNHNS